MKIRLIIYFSSLFFMSISTQAQEIASQHRLDEVAKRGKQVMPFDLEQTTHIFTKTMQGGLQQVIAKDNTNVAQIKLIREHLLKIAQAFGKGPGCVPHPA